MPFGRNRESLSEAVIGSAAVSQDMAKLHIKRPEFVFT